MSEQHQVKKTESALRQAGLESTAFECRTLSLAEVPGMAIARLRSLGMPDQFPGSTGQCSGDDPALLCLRPGEWLAVSESHTPADLLAEMTRRAGSDCLTVLDNSHGLAVLRLQGRGAPWLLAKLSGLDFLAGTQNGAHCARTRVGQIGVTVHYRELEQGAFGFDLVLDRSYARYLWELLTASADHADDLALAYGDAA
jgi:heterotetrameric sarcosine oxidase gamma subunit